MFKIISVIVVGIAIGVGVGYRVLFKAKPDNVIEEFAEEIIKQETGIDIDLSPDSPEKI